MAGLRHRTAADHLRLAVAGLTAALLTAACADPGPAVAPTSAASSTAAATPTAGQELAAMLVQPAGFADVPGDQLSGPVGRAEAVRVFADHAGDAAFVLDHGYAGGYLRTWQATAPAPDPADPTGTPTVTVTSAVLRFDAADGAAAVLAYFKTQSAKDQYKPLTLPKGLGAGFGFSAGPDTLGIAVRGYTWQRGEYLVQVTVQYISAAIDPEQAAALAAAQNAAVRPGAA